MTRFSPSIKSHLQSLSLLALSSLTLAVAAQRPGPAPRFDAWTIIGPGGGGTTVDPIISPADPNLVLLRCDMTGNYITHDGGQSWRMFNLRAGVSAFAFDPADPNRIYAGGAALWRSDNQGRTWRMIFPNPADNTVEHQNGDHSDYSLTSSDRNYISGLTIRQIVVDSANSSIIHIAFTDSQSPDTTLLVSTDAGTSFHHERDFPGDQILLLKSTPNGLLAIGSRGVYTSPRAGLAKSPKPIDARSGQIVHASAGVAGGVTYLYATTSKGELFVSEDSGLTWQARTPSLGQQSGDFAAVAASANNGQTAYIGFRGLKLGNRTQDIYNGIASTHDAGRTWSIVFRESTQPAANLDPSWVEQRAVASGTSQRGPIFFDSPDSLAVAPNNPAICYATDLFRTYRTLDAGKTWARSTPYEPRKAIGQPAASTSPPPMASSSTHSIPNTSSSTTPTSVSSPRTTAARRGSRQPTASLKPGATQPTGSPSTLKSKASSGQHSAACTICPGPRCGVTVAFHNQLAAASASQLTAAAPGPCPTPA